MKPTIIPRKSEEDFPKHQGRTGGQESGGHKAGRLDRESIRIVTRQGSVRNCCGRSLPNWQA